MSLRDIARIAGSAMTAQAVRLNTVASNLANANSASSSEAEVYRARKPVFAAVLLDNASDMGSSTSVQVLDVIKVDSPSRKEHEPGNPIADAEGYVYYPNFSPIGEMTDMMSASTAFKTNVEVLISLKAMQRDLLALGED